MFLATDFECPIQYLLKEVPKVCFPPSFTTLATMGGHVLRGQWGKTGGNQSFEVHRRAATAETLTCQHQTAPVRQDVTSRLHSTLERAPAPRTCLSFLLEPPQQQDECRGTISPQIHQVHTEERRVLAFKWDLQQVCWFYTSGSGRAAAGMTPDRKYRLRCSRVPKPPSASGVHKPPGSSNYDILTHNKQYRTPGEISLIFNLA